MSKMGQISEKASWEQLSSLVGFMMEFLSKLLNLSQVVYWLGHKDELKERLEKVFSAPTYADKNAETREYWEYLFNSSLVGGGVNFNSVKVPKKPKGGGWKLVFVPEGLTLNLLIEIIYRHSHDHLIMFTHVFSDKDFDAGVPINIRNTKSSYAVWIHRGNNFYGSDSGDRSKTTVGNSDPDMLVGGTFLENLLFEFGYHEHCEDYQVPCAFICSGSRSADGKSAPIMRWHPETGFEFEKININAKFSGYLPSSTMRTHVTFRAVSA